jgi:hypothetical protein
MRTSQGHRVWLRTDLLLLASALLFFCLPLRAQELGREAIAVFPPDTTQLTFADLAELRTQPGYWQIHLFLFSQRAKDFESMFSSLGDDPEKNVDEVVLGWRNGKMDASTFFGLAEGNFDSSAIQTMVSQKHLPVVDYAGYMLAGYPSGPRSGLYFAFLDSNTAAFGRLADLKTLIDGYVGNKPSLSSNAKFAAWASELEGSAPQWGITTGAGAAQLATPWLMGSGGSASTLTPFFQPIDAVLYRVSWSSDFTAHISIVCENSETAGTLSRLLDVWQNSPAALQKLPLSVQKFVQGLEISNTGARVEMKGSGPPDLLGELFQGMHQ